MKKIFDVLWDSKEYVELFVDDVFEAPELNADSIKYDKLTCFVNNQEVEVTGTTWAGYTLDKDDLLRKLIAEYVNNATYISFNYVADEVKALKENNLYIYTSKGRGVPDVYYNEWFEKYDCMIDYTAYDSSEFVLYVNGDDEGVLLNAETGETISDNNFAIDGVLDDLSNPEERGVKVQFHDKSFEEVLAQFDINIA